MFEDVCLCAVLPEPLRPKSIERSKTSQIRNWLNIHYCLDFSPTVFIYGRRLELTNKELARRAADMLFTEILKDAQRNNDKQSHKPYDRRKHSIEQQQRSDQHHSVGSTTEEAASKPLSPQGDADTPGVFDAVAPAPPSSKIEGMESPENTTALPLVSSPQVEQDHQQALLQNLQQRGTRSSNLDAVDDARESPGAPAWPGEVADGERSLPSPNAAGREPNAVEQRQEDAESPSRSLGAGRPLFHVTFAQNECSNSPHEPMGTPLAPHEDDLKTPSRTPIGLQEETTPGPMWRGEPKQQQELTEEDLATPPVTSSTPKHSDSAEQEAEGCRTSPRNFPGEMGSPDQDRQEQIAGPEATPGTLSPNPRAAGSGPIAQLRRRPFLLRKRLSSRPALVDGSPSEASSGRQTREQEAVSGPRDLPAILIAKPEEAGNSESATSRSPCQVVDGAAASGTRRSTLQHPSLLAVSDADTATKTPCAETQNTDVRAAAPTADNSSSGNARHQPPTGPTPSGARKEDCNSSKKQDAAREMKGGPGTVLAPAGANSNREEERFIGREILEQYLKPEEAEEFMKHADLAGNSPSSTPTEDVGDDGSCYSWSFEIRLHEMVLLFAAATITLEEDSPPKEAPLNRADAQTAGDGSVGGFRLSFPQGTGKSIA